MFRTYPLHTETRQRPESLRQIFRRLEREITDEQPSRRRIEQTARPRSGFPF